MKFMLISYATKEWESGQPPDPRLLAAIPRLYENMPKAAALMSTGGLGPSALGAKVRVSGGKVLVTDGPFAETKEIVGGYAIVDVSSHDSANPTQTMKMARAGFIIGLTAPDEGRRNVVLRARRSVWSGHLYEHQTVAPAVGARRADCSFYRCPPGLVARRTDDGGHLQVCGWAGCASEDGRRLRPLA